MSTMTGTFDLSHASPLPARPAAGIAAGARPWGFWGTLGWGLFSVAAGFVAAMAYTVIWMLTHQLRAPDPAEAAYATVTGMVASVAPLVVLVIAAKIRQWRLREYFALRSARLRDLVLGIACLAALIVIFEAMPSLLGIDDGSSKVVDAYRAARLAGVLPLLWVAMVVVAPVTEELLFRGFLHRGWSRSWLGVTGTVVLASALWALLHQQYSWLGILFIFLMGLIFGWLRQRSGSTTLPIVLHALNNLFATTVVAVRVEWLG
jgi:membrane protease YdiL (CAAX protease family)